MRVTRIFLLFFCNSFFFAYRHSDLEGSCSNGTKTRREFRCCLQAVVGHEIWHWAARFETSTERNFWAYDACAVEVWTEGGFTLALFQGCAMGREELLERVQTNFSFRNKFITLLPCSHPVDNNTFSKICVFKSLTGHTDNGDYENRNAHFKIIMKSKVKKSLCCCMIKMKDRLCVTPI